MKKRIVFGGIGVLLLALVVLRIIQASSGTEPAPDVNQIRASAGIPVEVARAAVAPLVVRREYTGTLRGIRSATVRARTPDEIVEIPVDVGQRVAAGDVLVRQSSEGSAAAVRQARAAWEQARRTVERLRPLHEEGALSAQDWDNALTGLEVAEANLAAAQRAILLTSPIAGVVTDILGTPGSFPGAGDPLVRVSDLSRVQLTFQVSAAQARELTLGQRAVLLDGGLEGRVSRIALQADPVTRLLEVEVTFAESTTSSERPQVVPGAIATISVEVGRRDSALCVPRVAVREGVAWVVGDDGVAQRRDVRVGLESVEVIEVLEGIEAGEHVVVAGASLLSEGARTRIVGAASPDEG
ncbi:MAG: efflux RND transporter periplasmic adaptor subunit [Gemmatimonadales bacterium]|jgi:membrane fusion protein (multidrug efflux system)